MLFGYADVALKWRLLCGDFCISFHWVIVKVADAMNPTSWIMLLSARGCLSGCKIYTKVNQKKTWNYFYHRNKALINENGLARYLLLYCGFWFCSSTCDFEVASHSLPIGLLWWTMDILSTRLHGVLLRTARLTLHVKWMWVKIKWTLFIQRKEQTDVCVMTVSPQSPSRYINADVNKALECWISFYYAWWTKDNIACNVVHYFALFIS